MGASVWEVKKKKPFDKYYYYSAAVQSPESDVEFMRNTYRSLTGVNPQTLREDFCGSFAICCDWTGLGESYRAIGVDYDPVPLAYGTKNYLSKLEQSRQGRIQTIEADVLKQQLPSADVVCALNFSYFCFKQRSQMLAYYRSVHESLNENGVFILDCFGGSQCYEANVEETEHEDEGFSYFWDQDNFNPVNHHAKFYIHFKRKGEARRDRVFSYDWRLWSLAELRDILQEAGFKSSRVYWEGDDGDGEGNGVFAPTEYGEECESWIAYLVAEK